jgi:hypothetical protein
VDLQVFQYKMSKRISAVKHYARLIQLIAIANGEDKESITRHSIAMPVIGPHFEPIGWTTYTRTDARVQQIRDALRSLARARNLEKRELRYPLTLPDAASARVVVKPDGTIRIVTTPVKIAGDTMNFFRDQFLPALERCDVRRIRLCPICDKLFFALRLDQQACSPKCSRPYRARQFRLRAKQYEKNRKENRRRKAARPALRRKRK